MHNRYVRIYKPNSICNKKKYKTICYWENVWLDGLNRKSITILCLHDLENSQNEFVGWKINNK